MMMKREMKILRPCLRLVVRQRFILALNGPVFISNNLVVNNLATDRTTIKIEMPPDLSPTTKDKARDKIQIINNRPVTAIIMSNVHRAIVTVHEIIETAIAEIVAEAIEATTVVVVPEAELVVAGHLANKRYYVSQNPAYF